ncbi:MAG: VanW family protein [Alkalinema sp. RU_4_3]|nr:VanW family protein [Alkalinema sp. RU_4_3]
MPRLKALLRRLPFSWRLRLQLRRRDWRDRRSGLSGRWADVGQVSPDWRVQSSVTQVLKATPYSENKRHNLLLGIGRVEPLVILPGQVFSFWRAVGEPGEAQGYQPGRAIVNDELQPVVGGGLCQLSGLIYMLGLQVGLTVVERHAHSQDIYTDETRFTPLGSDATVVYGYKDLRLENNLEVPVQFRFVVEAEAITAAVWASDRLVCYEVDYRVSVDGDGRKRVRTVRCERVGGGGGGIFWVGDAIEETIAETVYG